MRKLKEVNGKPQRRLFETSYLNTTPISSYYCVQFIPGVYFLLSTFWKQTSILKSAVTRKRSIYVFFYSQRKEDFIKERVYLHVCFMYSIIRSNLNNYTCSLQFIDCFVSAHQLLSTESLDNLNYLEAIGIKLLKIPTQQSEEKNLLPLIDILTQWSARNIYMLM